MKKEWLLKYPTGMILGFFTGFLFVHPFSMVFQGIFIPIFRIDVKSLVYAFHPQHLPMALFFGLLGMTIGALNIFYVRTLLSKII